MTRTHFLTVLVSLFLLTPTAARAADYLSCQADFVAPDCGDVAAPGDPLHITASCQECSGGGSDINCSPEEKVTAASLSIVTAADIQPVQGSFSHVGTCGFGLPQFKFSNSLAKGQYLVLVTVPPHEAMELLSFTVGNGTTPTSDGGTTPTSDGGTTPGSDGGGSTLTDGGTAPGTDGGTGDGDGDDGCDCRITSKSTGGALFLFLIALAVLAVRRRRCR